MDLQMISQGVVEFFAGTDTAWQDFAVFAMAAGATAAISIGRILF